MIRICPGRFFADATVWLTIATVLAVFDMGPYVDPGSRKEKPPEISFVSGFSRFASALWMQMMRNGLPHILQFTETIQVHNNSQEPKACFVGGLYLSMSPTKTNSSET